MEVYGARLASFSRSVPAKKKGSADGKSSKTLKWPHKSPSPAQLAQAGFSYQPSSSNPDNTACFLCHNNMDGWEEEDDPFQEHLKFAPNCGWANAVCIERAISEGNQALEDPMAERLLQARTMTFGAAWPHEGKRGWICKVRKMAEAGWHYCPTAESDDFVRCAYCDLSLDGWEPKDDPFEEHQRRSPDCLFFTLSTLPAVKPRGGRTKKGRQSKASRLSTQSTASAMSEDISMTDVNQEECSTLSIADTTRLGRTAKAKRHTSSKAKKEAPLVPPQPHVVSHEDSQLASSFNEPEDDDFEVKIAQPPRSRGRGKKRKSEEMAPNKVDDIKVEIGPVDLEHDAPTKKRRTTRSKRTASHAYNTTVPDEGHTASQDIIGIGAADYPESTNPGAGKKKKTGTKRGSSMARKVSNVSTASKASLRTNVTSDSKLQGALDELEAALDANLDPPGTDHENDEEIVGIEPPKGRRLTRSKTGSKKTPASVAPVRKVRQTGEMTRRDDDHAAASALYNNAVAHNEETSYNAGHQSPKAKGGRRKINRKVSIEEEPEVQPSSSESACVLAPANVLGHSLESEVADESGHETNASVITTKKSPKRGRAKTANTKKTDKKSTKTGVDACKDEKAAVPVPMPSVATSKAVSYPAMADNAGLIRVEEAASPPLKRVEVAEDVVQHLPDENGVLSEAQNKDESRSLPKGQMPVASEDTAAITRSPPSDASSPQSSDAENQPPSSLPSQARPLPSKAVTLKSPDIRIPLAAVTPTASPSKGNFSRVQSTFPWTAIDVERILSDTPTADKQYSSPRSLRETLGSPERKLSVEEWINLNAAKGEERLRNECERIVGRFEGEGLRALRTLEGIVCKD